MIKSWCLETLQCPNNQTKLALADDDLLARLNAKVEAGELINQGGMKIEEALEGALVREDGKYIYPIVDGLPLMISDEVIIWEE